jgi:hypothetical protein
MRTLLAVAVLSWSLLPQDPARPAAMLRTAEQLAATTAEHRLLQSWVGTWDVVSTTYGPAAAAQEVRGELVAKPWLDGRYLLGELTLAVGERRLHGVQILGYDTLRAQFTSSWRDDASTWAVDCSGPARSDDAARWDLRGTLADAQSPTGRAFRCEVDTRTAGVVRWTTFTTVDGQDLRVQSQVWTRR